MADGAQKTWLPLTLNRFGQKKAVEALHLTGKALPCSVTAIPTPGAPIVTVKFEVNAAPFTLPNITVPMFGPEYIRYPITVGCKGVVFPADVYLGGVSGLGGGVADLTTPANLSALVFFPIGNKGWTASEAPTSLLLYGPDGVVIRDAGSTIKITVSPETGVTIDLPAGKPLTINGQTIMNGGLQISGLIEAIGGGTYAGDIKTTGDIIAGSGTGDQVTLQNHIHGGVQGGGGSTEPPTGGT